MAGDTSFVEIAWLSVLKGAEVIHLEKKKASNYHQAVNSFLSRDGIPISMSVLQQTLIVLPARTLLNWAENGAHERQRCRSQPDRVMHKWKVQTVVLSWSERSELLCLLRLLWSGFLYTS